MPGTILELSGVDSRDAELLFNWRNDPEIVGLGKTKSPVTWEEHTRWLVSILNNPRHLIFKIAIDGSPAGQVRFDQSGNGDVEVSIYLLAQHRHRGLGTQALKEACWRAFRYFRTSHIVATVQKANQTSARLFTAAGFTRQAATNDEMFDYWRLQPVPHNRLTIDETYSAAIAATVMSGRWSAGPRVEELERRLSEMAGVATATCVSSGSSALRLALLSVGVKEGDRVLVPAYSCVALPNAVLACEAIPVPVDVDPESWQLDPKSAQKAAAKTAPAAIIAVNMFGGSAPIDALKALRVPVIEDCAHAFGISVDGRRLGARGDVAIMSFHATKLIAAGEGGAVLSDSTDVARFVRQYRDYADQPPSRLRQNDLMTDLEATLGLCQLKQLDGMIALRQERASRYLERLSAYAGRTGSFRLPVSDQLHARYRFVIELGSMTAEKAIKELDVFGIGAAQPVDCWLPITTPDVTVARRAFKSALSLPLYPTLSFAELDRVSDALVRVCESSKAAA